MTPSEYLLELSKVLKTLDLQKVTRLTNLIRKSRGTIFVCGNGGSAATASHLAADLNKTVLGKKPLTAKPKFRIFCLNDSIPLMTAWGNDTEYKHIFSQQLRNLGRPGDLLIVLSASGNSPNILEAVRLAKRLKIKTFGLLGFGGGKAKSLLDDCLVVNSDNYGPVEDTHLIINHLVTDELKDKGGR